MYRSALRAAAVAASSCLSLLALPARMALAYEMQTAPSGAPVRWTEGEVVFTLELDDRAADLARGAAEEAALDALATWSSAGGPLLVGNADTKHGRGHDDEGDDDESGDRAVIRFATDREDPDLHAESLARTRLSFDPHSGRAQRVTITVNAFDYRWSTGEPCDGAYDLEATLAHEIGHALGLRHSRDPQATMFTQPQPCERDRRDLAADDLAGIAALYGDTTSAAAAGPVPTPAGCSAAGARSAGSGAATAAILLFLSFLVRSLTGRVGAARSARSRTHARG